MSALEQSTSPYIRLHKDNPVQWRLWSPEALDEARTQDKPIFLSMGYTGCHWCHVMNTESFSDPETAAVLNENFIPILVDRGQRPDIDQVYQAAAQLMGYGGGWPLSMFLTPAGMPFFVGGFAPKTEQPGQPSFRQMLDQTLSVFKDRRAEADLNAGHIRGQLDALYNRDMRVEIESISLDLAAMRVTQRFDIFFGGLQGTTKFPATPLLEVVWNAYLRSGMPQYSQTIFVTLDAMLFGGLYDHIGGGFFRYVADERWLLPHYEKMIYDNALMTEVMTGIWQHNRNELCRMRVAETVGWMLREMRVGDAFAAGLDASSEGTEGKFYVWSEAEIDAALAGTFSSKFKQTYGVTHDGNAGQGRNILRRLARTQGSTEADESLLTRQRELLLAARDKRVRPLRDDNVLADWNGLAIAALANAGAVFERPEWIQAAIAAFNAIVKDLGDGNRLSHCRGATGFADDYANMARAALILWEVTGDKNYVEHARGWVDTLNDYFWNETLGGYCYTPSDGEKLIVRARTVMDAQTPAANGVMMEVLCRMALLLREPAYGNRASQLLSALGEEAGRQYLSSGTFINGIEFLANALQVVVVGARNSAKTQELLRTVWSKALPNRMLWHVENGADLPDGHPAKEKAMGISQPTVFVAQRNLVSEPFSSPVALSQFLTLPTQAPQQDQRAAVH